MNRMLKRFFTAAVLILVGCQREQSILTHEQLKQYEKETDITGADVSEYFDVSYRPEVEGHDGPVPYIMDLVLKQGYFPADDIKINGTGKTRTWEESYYSIYWLSEENRIKNTFYPVENNEEVEIELSGHLLSYEIPAEYIREDEYGRYFCLKQINNRYYENGRMSYVDEDGNVQLLGYTWWPVLLRAEEQ